MCVSICLCVYVCASACLYACVYMCLFVYVCVYTCVFLCVCLCLFVYMHVPICVCAYACACLCMCVYIHVSLCVCTCAYLCVCMYQFVCVYACACLCMSMHACLCVCVCANVHVCVLRKGFWVFRSSTLHLIPLVQGPLTQIGAKLAIRDPKWPPCLCPIAQGQQAHIQPPWLFFPMGLGIWTQVLTFIQQMLLPTDPSLQPGNNLLVLSLPQVHRVMNVSDIQKKKSQWSLILHSLLCSMPLIILLLGG